MLVRKILAAIGVMSFAIMMLKIINMWIFLGIVAVLAFIGLRLNKKTHISTEEPKRWDGSWPRRW